MFLVKTVKGFDKWKAKWLRIDLELTDFIFLQRPLGLTSQYLSLFCFVSQLLFSTYYANTAMGWYPDIILEPTQAYMLKMAEGGSLTYPSDFVSSYHINSDTHEPSNPMMVDLNVHDYQYNGSITAAVVVEGIEIGSEQDQLAVFVDGECRGYVNGMYVPFTDSYIFPLMTYSNYTEEEMSFDFYHASEGKTYNNISVVMFNNDMIIGDALNTYRINIEIGDVNVPVETQLGNIYPNPFNPSTTILFDVPEQAHVKIIIYDITGRKIGVLVNEFYIPGSYKLIWNTEMYPYNQLSSGVYLYSYQTPKYKEKCGGAPVFV